MEVLRIYFPETSEKAQYTDLFNQMCLIAFVDNYWVNKIVPIDSLSALALAEIPKEMVPVVIQGLKKEMGEMMERISAQRQKQEDELFANGPWLEAELEALNRFNNDFGGMAKSS